MELKGVFFAALIVSLMLAAMAIDRAMAENDKSSQVSGERSQGSPPEALATCKGKQVGATVRIKTPRGDVIEAVCVSKDDQLEARPLNPPPDQHRR